MKAIPIVIAFACLLSACQDSPYIGQAPQYEQVGQLTQENFQSLAPNPVRVVRQQPLSTFSVDVDTGSYTLVRRDLMAGRLPQRGAVRAEEMINYFHYAAVLPQSADLPFTVSQHIGPTPWNPATHLLKIGIQGYDLPKQHLPPANLVFLIDVSGSMESLHKLPLLKESLRLLVGRLRPIDRLSIVVYASTTGVLLAPTPGNQKAKILAALAQLQAGGSTNGGAGLQLAYRLAQQAFIENGINRVLLATDGDFNVGIVNFEDLKSWVSQQRASGIALTTLGFGSGNYNDHLMEQLADAGNGHYAYIDRLAEAKKVLLTEMSATLLTIAKDVKIQIEFNPSQVSQYRLIGYENRILARQDFANDRVDAGDIGAGHTVTALYELTLASDGSRPLPALRYQPQSAPTNSRYSPELAFLKLRYKRPQENTSRLMVRAITLENQDSGYATSRMVQDYHFATAVAAFAEKIRGNEPLQGFSFNDILRLAKENIGEDRYSFRQEFLAMVRIARDLSSLNSISMVTSKPPPGRLVR